MSIFNKDRENNFITEENNNIKSKSDELNKITLEIKKSQDQLNILTKEIKKIKSSLKEELNNMEKELNKKQEEFEIFNIKLENSFIDDKDKKIKNLEETKKITL